MINKFYFVRGQIFENYANRMNGKGKALRFCKENNIDENEIFELSSENELAYLKELMTRNDVSHIHSHKKISLIKDFENKNGETLPAIVIEPSFTFRDKEQHKHYVMIINSLYELTKEFIILKKLFDYLHQDYCYLEIYYLDEKGSWKEWTLGDNSLLLQMNRESKKRSNIQRKAIRDRQKFDRLLKLRSEGKITEKQTQELYRLEKVFGGGKYDIN